MGSVIVGVDDTPEARDGLELARQLCKELGWRLQVISVHSDSIFYEGLDGIAEVRKLYFARMREIAGEMLGDSFEFHKISETSVPAGLTRLTEELGASALVIGSSHRGPIGRVLLGDVGSRLIQGSTVPTFVAPRGYAVKDHDGIRRIGVGFDGSNESRTALRYSAELAAPTDCRLTLIGVAPLFTSPGRIAHTNQGFQETIDTELQGELDVAAEFPGIEVETVLKHGDAAERLAEASADLDLLVMGSRGYGPVRRVLLGGTSLQVTRSALCPVALVPKHAEDPDEAEPNQ